MTESEAREIFHDKLALCDVLGLDVRQACIDAGVPAVMLDRIIRDHDVKTAATTRIITDPTVLPLSAAGAGQAGPRQAGPDTDEPGFLCLGQKLTGLPMIVWVLQGGTVGSTVGSTGGSTGGASAGMGTQRLPYLRAQADHSQAPRTDCSVRVSLAEPPRQLDGPPMAPSDFGSIAEFIRANRDALVAHWNRSDGRVGLLRKIVPLS